MNLCVAHQKSRSKYPDSRLDQHVLYQLIVIMITNDKSLSNFQLGFLNQLPEVVAFRTPRHLRPLIEETKSIHNYWSVEEPYRFHDKLLSPLNK